MSEYRIQSETLEGIADAIREKTGDSALIAPEDMADEIASISGGWAGLPLIYEEIINIADDTRNNGDYTASKFGTDFGTDNANLDIESSQANTVYFVFTIDNNTSVSSCGQNAVVLAHWKPSVSRFCVGIRKDNAFSYLGGATTTFRIASGSVIHKYVYKIS